MKNYKKIIYLIVPLILTSCAKRPNYISIDGGQPSIENSSSFVSSSSKESVEIIPMTLKTSNGLTVKFDNKGAKIDSVDFNGNHIGENGFIAGRVANRIANGTFTLNGVTYNTDKNNGRHTLHGGSRGFGERTWTLVEQTENSITFSFHSPDGDMGFPGNMDITTTYTLEDDGTLAYEITATSDADTVFNPINHLYMNMNGNRSNANHDLWIDADTYTKASSDLIPTGEIVSVSGTTLDYTTKNAYHGNNDSNLVLNGSGYRKVAEMDGTTLGYRVEVFTDRVGLQLYSNGQFICLEAQDFPDAVHHENFPSIILEANTEYYSKSAYKFSKL